MSKELAPSEHPNFDDMQEWWSQGLRATAIGLKLKELGLPPVRTTALARYGQRYWSTKVRLGDEARIEDLNQIVAAAEEEGLAVKKVQVNRKTGWGWEKDEDNVSIQVPRETTTQVIEFTPINEFQLERAAIPDIKINVPKVKKAQKPDNIGLAISLPDMQIGLHRDGRGEMITSQDESAIDVAFQLVAYLNKSFGVDYLVYQGDNLDFAEFSRHRSAPGFRGNTQYAIDRLGAIVATGNACAPNAEGVYMKGNHEDRLVNKLTDQMPDLVGITRVGDEDPVLGVDYLCRFNEYNVEYIRDYPNGEFWVNEGTRFIHGSAVSSGKGATSAGWLSKGVNTIGGHIHRGELVWGRRSNSTEAWQTFAGSAGTLAKIDGEVPSSKTGVDEGGSLPIRRGTEDWQQGIMLVYYDKTGKDAWPVIIPINNGTAFFDNRLFVASVDGNGKVIDR